MNSHLIFYLSETYCCTVYTYDVMNSHLPVKTKIKYSSKITNCCTDIYTVLLVNVHGASFLAISHNS